ncbi:hypothetical protein P4200_23295 [Pseudomonas aeruginosa]|nr:hypothetical protein [Pseudomonas aeruginosa]
MIADTGDMLKVSGSSSATPVRRTEARQHADQDAEQHADHHQAEVMGAEDQAHALHQGIEFAHGLALSGRRPRGRPVFRHPAAP